MEQEQLPFPQSAVAATSKSAPSVFLMLLTLRQEDGSVSMNRYELAFRAGLSPETIITAIQALVESRWIKQSPGNSFVLNPIMLKRLGLESGRGSHAA